MPTVWLLSHALALIVITAMWRSMKRTTGYSRGRALRAEFQRHVAEARAQRAESELAHAARDLQNAIHNAESSLAGCSVGDLDSPDGLRAAVDHATAVAAAMQPKIGNGTSSGERGGGTLVERVARRSIEAASSIAGFQVSIVGIPSLPADAEPHLTQVLDSLVANAARAAAGLGDVWVVISPEGIVVQNPTADAGRAQQRLREHMARRDGRGPGVRGAREHASKIGMRIDWDVDPVAQLVTAYVSTMALGASDALGRIG